jgi:hypothetical protein
MTIVQQTQIRKQQQQMPALSNSAKKDNDSALYRVSQCRVQATVIPRLTGQLRSITAP